MSEAKAVPMKRYLTIVVCAAACLLTLDACDSQSTAQKSLTELKLPESIGAGVVWYEDA